MEDIIYNLVVAAQEKDEKAMINLLSKFSVQLNSYSRRLNGEDTLQELRLFFVELVQNLHLEGFATQTDKAIISYISRSLKHKFFKLKHESKLRQCETELFPTYDIPYVVHDFEDIILKNSISCLNGRERDIVYLLYFYGYSVKFIAKVKEISVQAVYQANHRAMKKLKKYYF